MLDEIALNFGGFLNALFIHNFSNMLIRTANSQIM
jgi:hypothetical protein